MSVRVKLLLLFLFSAACEAALIWMYPEHLSTPRSRPFITLAAGFLGTALAPFLVGGIVPVIAWAFERFRAQSANLVVIVWAFLITVFVYFQYYGLANP
jgi:hypothetical protein